MSLGPGSRSSAGRSARCARSRRPPRWSSRGSSSSRRHRSSSARGRVAARLAARACSNGCGRGLRTDPDGLLDEFDAGLFAPGEEPRRAPARDATSRCSTRGWLPGEFSVLDRLDEITLSRPAPARRRSTRSIPLAAAEHARGGAAPRGPDSLGRGRARAAPHPADRFLEWLDLDKDRIRRDFDRAATTYDAHASVQNRLALELAARIDDEPASILELGCGTGTLTAHLRARFPAAEIVAVDFSPAMAAPRPGAVPDAESSSRTSKSSTSTAASTLPSRLRRSSGSPTLAATLTRLGAASDRLLLGTFGPRTFWQLRELGVEPTLPLRSAAEWCALLGDAHATAQSLDVVYPSCRAFLRALKGVGAAERGRRIAVGARRCDPPLRRALRRPRRCHGHVRARHPRHTDCGRRLERTDAQPDTTLDALAQPWHVAPPHSAQRVDRIRMLGEQENVRRPGSGLPAAAPQRLDGERDSDMVRELWEGRNAPACDVIHGVVDVAAEELGGRLVMERRERPRSTHAHVVGLGGKSGAELGSASPTEVLSERLNGADANQPRVVPVCQFRDRLFIAPPLGGHQPEEPRLRTLPPSHGPSVLRGQRP